jgi:hypothetical protein
MKNEKLYKAGQAALQVMQHRVMDATMNGAEPGTTAEAMKEVTDIAQNNGFTLQQVEAEAQRISKGGK